MEEKIFANGIIFKLPKDNAPDFVKGSISFKTDEAIQWIREHSDNGWCNIDLKVGQSGKAYAELNTWKPDNQNSRPAPFEDDVVF